MGDANDPNSNPYETPPAFTGGPAPPMFQPGMVYDLPAEAKQMAMLAHLLGAIMNFLGPLIIWLIGKEKHPFIDNQGKEALNFQLTVLIAHIVCIAIFALSCGILFFMPFLPYVLQLTFGIIGAVKANNGEAYRYPMTIRFVQ